MKQLKEGASCSVCRFSGESEGDKLVCSKKGLVKPSDVCKKYEFNPFAKRVKRQRRFDTSMLDPLDFDINL